MQSSQMILLLTSPLWLPFLGLLVYLFYALCNLCTDGLFFLAETYLGKAIRPTVAMRAGLAIPSLVIYPIVITLEMGFFFIVYLGSLPQDYLAKLKGRKIEWGTLERFFVGLCFPMWAIPSIIVLTIRFYIFVLRLLIDAGRPRTPFFATERSRGIFESFVGLRYLKAKKSQSFISAITLFSIVGVMVGVCALVVVLSVMSGFEEDLKSKILGTNSHAIVLKFGGDVEEYGQAMDKALQVPGVIGATPFIYSEVMLTTESSGSGVILKGIDDETVGTVTDLTESLTEGPSGPLKTLEQKQAAVTSLDPSAESGTGERLPGLLLGEQLAQSMHVLVGDTVTIVSPLGEIGPMGTRVPKFRRFKVAGIFHSGMYEYDAKFTYASLSAAQSFFSMGDSVTGIELKVDDIYKAKEIARNVESVLGYPFWTRDWMSMNKNLFSALYLEKIVMGIILGMIIVVAALNIISTLIMGVIEKGKEIAILKAMGASGIQVMKVFMIEGLIIGFIGTTLGLLLGWTLCYILDTTHLIRLNPDVYYLDTLPVKISSSMFALVALAAMTISFAASLYPSWRASKQDPVEGLRYE